MRDQGENTAKSKAGKRIPAMVGGRQCTGECHTLTQYRTARRKIIFGTAMHKFRTGSRIAWAQGAVLCRRSLCWSRQGPGSVTLRQDRTHSKSRGLVLSVLPAALLPLPDSTSAPST
eukprot:1709547-Rhodomonas_salina.1